MCHTRRGRDYSTWTREGLGAITYAQIPDRRLQNRQSRTFPSSDVPWNKRQWTKTDIQEVPLKHKKNHLSWLNTRRDYPEQFWSLHPCPYSTPRKTALSTRSCSEQRDESENFQSSLPVPTIPWLWEGLANMQHLRKTWTSGNPQYSRTMQFSLHQCSLPRQTRNLRHYPAGWLQNHVPSLTLA